MSHSRIAVRLAAAAGLKPNGSFVTGFASGGACSDGIGFWLAHPNGIARF